MVVQVFSEFLGLPLFTMILNIYLTVLSSLSQLYLVPDSLTATYTKLFPPTLLILLAIWAILMDDFVCFSKVSSCVGGAVKEKRLFC